MVQVKQLVDRALYSATPAESVAVVTRRMTDWRVGAIIILEEGTLRGIFSERDVMTRVLIPRLDAEQTLVGQVMTQDVVTIGHDAGIEYAMETMKTNRCRHLPVMNGDIVLGLLSMRDLMNFELAWKTEELHRMRAYVHGVA